MFIYNAQGVLIHYNMMITEEFESGTPTTINFADFIDVTRIAMNHSLLFADPRDNLFFEGDINLMYDNPKETKSLGEFSVVSDVTNLESADGYLTIKPAGTTGNAMLFVGSSGVNNYNALVTDSVNQSIPFVRIVNFEVDKQAMENLYNNFSMSWKIYWNKITNTFYFYSVDFDLYMYSAGNRFIRLDTLASQNVIQYGGFRIVENTQSSVPKSAQNTLNLPQSAPKSQAEVSASVQNIRSSLMQSTPKTNVPQPIISTPKTYQSTQPLQQPVQSAPITSQQVQTTSSNSNTVPPSSNPGFIDISMTLLGSLVCFKDTREGKYFQNGVFENGSPILDLNNFTDLNGHVRIVQGSNNNNIRLLMKTNEYISTDGVFATKTNLQDDGTYWRIYKRTSSNKIYFYNESTNKFMYASGSGIVRMDILSSQNIRLYGGFDIVQ